MLQGDVEYVPCPCCGADASNPWAIENGFSAGKCKVCGLVYVNPRPSEATINEANKVGVHNGDEGSLLVTTRRRPRKVGYYKNVMRKLLANDLCLPVKWLDVGAGYGEVLEAAKSLAPMGSELLGVEPMAVKVAVAQARGLDIIDRPLETVGCGYDVISLINVYSHIPDFERFGKTLVGMLKPGGALFLETGNGADLKSRAEYPDKLYLPDHLVFSGVAQMRKTFLKLGLVLERDYAKPVDGLLWSGKQAVRALSKGKLEIRLPYTSPFRAVFYVARKPR